MSLFEKGSVYEQPSIYNQGGGGGGGEKIPDGFKKVYYIEFKSAGNANSWDFQINNLNSNDKYYLTLLINSASAGTSTFRIIEVRNGDNFVSATANINGVIQYDLFAIRKLYYGIDITLPLGPLQLDFTDIGKVNVNGNNQSLTNGVFSNGALIHFLDHALYDSPERLNGTKFFKCLITDSLDNVKYNFIPVINLNTGDACIYESTTRTLKTNDNWIAGPIINE